MTRIDRLARLYAAASARARAAYAAGDRDGYRYSRAEMRRYAAALEGAAQ